MNTVFNFLKKRENNNKKLKEISLTLIHSLNLDLGKSTNCVFICFNNTLSYIMKNTVLSLLGNAITFYIVQSNRLMVAGKVRFCPSIEKSNLINKHGT